MWVKDALKREKENDKFTHYNDIHNFFNKQLWSGLSLQSYLYF